MTNKNITYIIGYTIERKDCLREKFCQLLENEYGDNVCSINQSAYKIEGIVVSDMENKLRSICKEAEQESGEKFAKDDFVKFYCSAQLVNCKVFELKDRIFEYSVNLK